MAAKFNFLADRARSEVKFAGTTNKPRRQGISKIMTELQLLHPDWPENHLQAHAKALWHERNRSAK